MALPPFPSPRAPLCALLTAVAVLGAAAPASAADVVVLSPSWGVAEIDKQPFRHRDTGVLLPSSQAWPRGRIMDKPPADGRDVRMHVWAFDAKGDPLTDYIVEEGDFQWVSIDQPLDVPAGVIAYLRYDFCVFGGGQPTSCLDPPTYMGRPPPDSPQGGGGGGGPPPQPQPGDVDADGHAVPADCDDRNSRVYPGAPEFAGNGVDDDCAGGDRAGRVTAQMSTRWAIDGRRTRIRRLAVVEAPPGAGVTVACRGRGCAFKAKTFAVNARGNVRLTRLFKRWLLPGARIEVRVTAPNAIGKVVRYRIRRGTDPRSRRLCLAPGAKKPVRCRRLTAA